MKDMKASEKTPLLNQKIKIQNSLKKNTLTQEIPLKTFTCNPSIEEKNTLIQKSCFEKLPEDLLKKILKILIDNKHTCEGAFATIGAMNSTCKKTNEICKNNKETILDILKIKFPPHEIIIEKNWNKFKSTECNQKKLLLSELCKKYNINYDQTCKYVEKKLRGKIKEEIKQRPLKEICKECNLDYRAIDISRRAQMPNFSSDDKAKWLLTSLIGFVPGAGFGGAVTAATLSFKPISLGIIIGGFISTLFVNLPISCVEEFRERIFKRRYLPSSLLVTSADDMV